MPRRKHSANFASFELQEVVLPGGADSLSVDIFDGKVIKKHTIEKVSFSDSTAIDDTSLPSDADTPLSSDAENETPTTHNPKGPSRSVLVGAFLKLGLRVSDYKHVGEDTGLDPSPKSYLDELLHREGCGSNLVGKSCSDCRINGAFHCDECSGRVVMCKGCILARHVPLPLHSIKVCIGSCPHLLLTNHKVRNGMASSSSLQLSLPLVKFFNSVISPVSLVSTHQLPTTI